MRAQHADHVLQNVQTQAKWIDELQDGEETASAPLLTFPEELNYLFRRCLRVILVASALMVLNQSHCGLASSGKFQLVLGFGCVRAAGLGALGALLSIDNVHEFINL